MLFVNEWRKEAPLEQIQNVDFRSTWLGKLLDYGTMTIATALTAGTISFDYTTNFRSLRANILEQREQRRRHASAGKMTIQRMLEAAGASSTRRAASIAAGRWRRRRTAGASGWRRA